MTHSSPNIMKRFLGLLERTIYPKEARKVRLNSPAYKDRQKGRDFLIVALGPSIGEYRDRIYDFISRENLITIGVNNCFDLNINFKYHAFTNRHRFAEYGSMLNNTKAIPLLSPYITRRAIKQIINKDKVKGMEYIMYLSNNDAKFDISQEGIILASCKSVTVLMIAVAIVMGARQIFVVGMDGYSELIEHSGGSIHYNASQPKYDFKGEKDKFLNHYYKLERYQTRFLREIREYQVRNGKLPFKILTPTLYKGHFDPEVLKIT